MRIIAKNPIPRLRFLKLRSLVLEARYAIAWGATPGPLKIEHPSPFPLTPIGRFAADRCGGERIHLNLKSWGWHPRLAHDIAPRLRNSAVKNCNGMAPAAGLATLKLNADEPLPLHFFFLAALV